MNCKFKDEFVSDNILIKEMFFEETGCFLKNIIFFDENEIICKIILPSKNKKKSLKSFSNEEFQEIKYDSFFKNNVKKEMNKNFKIIVQRKNEELKITKKGENYLDFFIKTKNFKGNLKNCPKNKIIKISEIIIDFLEKIEFSMKNFLDESNENYLIKEVKKIRNKKTKFYENPNKDFLKQYQSKLSKNEIENLKKIYDTIFFKKIEINKIKKEDFLITDEEKEIWLNQENISPEKFTKLKANFDRKYLIKSKYNESNKSKNEEKINKKNIFSSPQEIKKELDKYVIGQEKAKKIISVAAYNHIKRTNNPDLKIPKSNVFMLGPTGSGKTYLIKKLGEILNVPILIYDASSLTATGYVGNDLESIFNALTTKYNNDYKKCEKAIIYLDEIDKISASEIIADVNGSKAQQILLKAIEGNKFLVNSGSYGYHEEYEFDSSNILFVVGGAFTKLFENERKKNTIGFRNSNSSNEKNSTNFSTEKLIEYGMIREFVGRFSSIVQLEKHTKETLKKIILNSKDSIMKQYINIFKEEKIKIEITEEAIDEIVEIAFQKNTGARSLKTVFEELFEDIMFEYLGENKNIEKIEISKETIKNKIPKIFYK